MKSESNNKNSGSLPETFSQFYDQYAPIFYGDIKRTLYKEDVSVETLEKIFIDLWKSKKEFDPEKETFFVWALKKARTEIRLQKRNLVLKDLFNCQKPSD